MGTKADTSPAATLMLKEQAKRLRRLRQALCPYAVDAAAMAGVSSDAWRRYERGDAQVDTVALSRFLGAAKSAGADYIVSGRLSGLDEDLVRALAAAEAAEPSVDVPADTEGPPSRARGRKTARA